MIDRRDFYQRVTGTGERMSIDYVAGIVRDLMPESATEEILRHAATDLARELMRVEDEHGDRRFLNLPGEDGRVYLQTDFFDADDYKVAIEENERRIEELIRKNIRLKERAEEGGFSVQLRFELLGV